MRSSIWLTAILGIAAVAASAGGGCQRADRTDAGNGGAGQGGGAAGGTGGAGGAPLGMPDAPIVQQDASDGMTDQGSDAGPFSCGAGVTCQASQYCVPECCGGGCLLNDGGSCPTGATPCPLDGATGCMFCTAAHCTDTTAGCTIGPPSNPRRLYCLCN